MWYEQWLKSSEPISVRLDALEKQGQFLIEGLDYLMILDKSTTIEEALKKNTFENLIHLIPFVPRSNLFYEKMEKLIGILFQAVHLNQDGQVASRFLLQTDFELKFIYLYTIYWRTNPKGKVLLLDLGKEMFFRHATTESLFALCIEAIGEKEEQVKKAGLEWLEEMVNDMDRIRLKDMFKWLQEEMILSLENSDKGATLLQKIIQLTETEKGNEVTTVITEKKQK